MFTLITIALIIALVWFWYTDRRNTQTAVKTSVGTFAGIVKESASAIKVEADIAKTHNDIANIESDRLSKFADRNAERLVKSLLADVGLDDSFKQSQQDRLSAAQDRLAEAKTKAGK